jgi:hypothetical protein
MVCMYSGILLCLQREGVSGDGYSGRVSPHTHHEIYTGLDVARGEQVAHIPLGDYTCFNTQPCCYIYLVFF